MMARTDDDYLPSDDFDEAEDEELEEDEDLDEDEDEDDDWDDDDDWDEDEEDEADEELVQELQKRGDVVFSHNWEGGPGEYATYVYKMDGGYYLYDMFEETVDGPHASLKAALTDEALTVSSATTAIVCKELDFDALAALLTMDDTADEPVSVNGRNWPKEA